MKILILNSYKEQAYFDVAKSKGYYPNLKTQFDNVNISDSDEVASINKKYALNYKRTMKEALEILKLPWYTNKLITDEEVNDRTLELVVD